MPTASKKLVRSTSGPGPGTRRSAAVGRRAKPPVPSIAGMEAAPRLISAGPPPEWRWGGLTVVIGRERATLRYAREPVGSARPSPEAIIEAVQRARRRLDDRSRAPDELLPAMAAAYHGVLGRRRGAPGDRVPLVELRDELGDASRAQFAWDLARLRRERRMIVDGRRIDLGVATGHATSRRSSVVWIEDDGGGGMYFASFRLIAQEFRT